MPEESIRGSRHNPWVPIVHASPAHPDGHQAGCSFALFNLTHLIFVDIQKTPLLQLAAPFQCIVDLPA